MKVTILALCMLLCLVSCNLFAKEENGVLVLDDKSISNAIQFYDKLIIEFYAPWCQACKKFTPEFEKACEKMKTEKDPIYCAKIDIEKYKQVGDEYGATNYPTIIYFNKNDQLKYKGALKYHTFTNWVKTGQVFNSLKVNLQELDELKEKEHIFYTFFGDKESKEFKLWNMVAQYDEFRFFTHSDDQEAIQKYSIETPAIVAFRHFDEPIVKFEGEIERLNVMEFLREKGKAKCMYFNEIDKLNIFRAKKSAVFLIADEVRNQHVIDNFCTVAKKDNSEMMYAWASIHNKDQDDLREYIDVHNRPAPILVGITSEIHYGMMKFEYDGEVKSLSQKDLVNFVKRFKNGALERHYYDDHDKQWYHVTVPHDANHENYEDIVMDTDNDVLVYYYDTSVDKPGQVTYLHTELNELSTEIGRPDHLIITRYDWHKAPPVEQHSSKKSSLVLYPKNDKQNGIVYKGGKSIKQIKEFLQDNSSVYRELYPQREDL